MTAAAVFDLPTSQRPLPRIFNRLVIVLAVQAHLFAAVLIATSHSDYRSFPACIALWVVSSAVPLVCILMAARRTPGLLSARTFVMAAGLLIAVDFGMAGLVPTADRAGAAMWNWGAVGVTILTFAVFRPVRDVLILAGMHGLVAVTATATALGHAAGIFSLLVVANAAVTPALAAAQYLSLYVRAVRLREQAITERRQIETREITRQALREDAETRLRELRAVILPFLADIVAGAREAGDPQVGETARQLADDLRRELVERRSGSWLLPVAPSIAPADGPSGHWPGITLLDPHRLLGHVRDADRAALIAFLGMLRHLPHWQRISVALTPDRSGHARPADSPQGTSATLIVVAMGTSAEDACRDTDVLAAASRLRTTLEADPSDVLTAEATLLLTQPSLTNAATIGNPGPASSVQEAHGSLGAA